MTAISAGKHATTNYARSAGRDLMPPSFRFTTIADDLHPGLHSVECELLKDTKDPGGGHEFRIISLMRSVAALTIHLQKLTIS